jgi:hypothetical protein
MFLFREVWKISKALKWDEEDIEIAKGELRNWFENDSACLVESHSIMSWDEETKSF